MAAITVEFGREHTLRRTLTLSRALKERVLSNFPEKMAVSVPGFGNQDFALRTYVKSFLENVSAPTLKTAFLVDGDGEFFDAIAIEVTELRVIATNAGNFSAANAKISYRFGADVESEGHVVQSCDCGQGVMGRLKSRTFKFIWEIEIGIEPGVSGVYEIDEFEITIATPCCRPEPPAAPASDEADDDLEDDEPADSAEAKRRRKSKKKGRDKRR